MAALANLVGVSTTTTGTGTLTLGSALQGLRTVAASGIADATIVSYAIKTGAAGSEQYENGTGTVGASGTTLTRTLVTSSTGSLLNLSGTSEVYITDLAGDHENGNIPTAAISDGATTPDPGSASLRYSSTTFRLMAFFGGVWRSIASIMQANTWTAAQRGTIVTLTDGATVTPDFNNQFFTWTIAGTGRTLANPTNLVAGQSGSIFIVQDATGSRTITAWGSAWDFAGGTPPTLSTAANAVDRLDYLVRTTGSIHANLVKDVK